MPTVRISVEMVSVETGVWCDTCLLSSAVTAWFTTTTGSETTLRSTTRCDEH